jgi:hypothetical protein
MRARARNRSTEKGPAKWDRRIATLDVEHPVGKREAAAILGISIATLDTWTARCGIPHLKYDVPGNPGNRGRVVYLPSELLQWRAQFKVGQRDIAAEVEELLLSGPGAERPADVLSPSGGPSRNSGPLREEGMPID